MYSKERKLSWSEVHASCEDLAKKIKRDFKPDVIIAISSGGLVPGKLLKEMLGVKNICVISARAYDENRQRGACVVEKNLSGKTPMQGQRVLVVDDVVDSGVTFTEVVKTLEGLSGNDCWQVKTAALLLKPKTSFIPDYYSTNAGDCWIVFPWDTGEVEEENV